MLKLNATIISRGTPTTEEATPQWAFTQIQNYNKTDLIKILENKAEKARKDHQSRSMVDELILSHSPIHTDHVKTIF